MHAFETALSVFTKNSYPQSWAEEQANLARSAAKLAMLPGQDQQGLLIRAIAADKAALQVYIASSYPRDFSRTTEDLKHFRQQYEFAANAGSPAFDSIAPAQ